MNWKTTQFLVACALASAAFSEEKRVYLEEANGDRLEIATLELDETGGYSVTMLDRNFSEHFLSMRPFKCLEGPSKHWCHVPYPYPLARNISADLTDLEYDFLFLWKDSGEYGINLWNGIYYKLADENGTITGELHEMDMNILASPPQDGDLRPIRSQDLHIADPDSHWLPVMVIE